MISHSQSKIVFKHAPNAKNSYCTFKVFLFSYTNIDSVFLKFWLGFFQKSSKLEIAFKSIFIKLIFNHRLYFVFNLVDYIVDSLIWENRFLPELMNAVQLNRKKLQYKHFKTIFWNDHFKVVNEYRLGR